MYSQSNECMSCCGEEMEEMEYQFQFQRGEFKEQQGSRCL